MKTKASRRRDAFSLVEILVVIAVILVLMTISIGAISGIRSSQMAAATETTLTRLASLLDMHIKAVRDEAKEGDISPFLTAAGNNRRVAAVLLMQNKLRTEFPQTFAEARLSAKAGYSTALSVDPAIPNLTGEARQFAESGICLMLALRQQRRGVTPYSEDTLPSSSFAKANSVSGQELYYPIDGWGSPIGFIREPSGNLELKLADFTGGTEINPFDPEGLVTSWPGTGATINRNLIPSLVSAGPDRVYGINPSTMAGATTAPEAADNLYSYRVRRSGGRGN